MQYNESIFNNEVKSYTANVLFNLIVGTNNINFRDVLNVESLEEIMYKLNLDKERSEKIIMTIELIKKADKLKNKLPTEITNPRDVYELLKNELRYESKEHFYIVCLDTRSNVIGKPIDLTKGTFTQVLINASTFYKEAIVNNAVSVIAVHNHPSGNPSPSKDDKKITKDLVAAGQAIGIRLKDHIIIGNGEYYSFENEGLLN